MWDLRCADSSLRGLVHRLRAVNSTLDRLDRTLVAFLRKWSIPALRVSLGIVFVWSRSTSKGLEIYTVVVDTGSAEGGSLRK